MVRTSAKNGGPPTAALITVEVGPDEEHLAPLFRSDDPRLMVALLDAVLAQVDPTEDEES